MPGWVVALSKPAQSRVPNVTAMVVTRMIEKIDAMIMSVIHLKTSILPTQPQ